MRKALCLLMLLVMCSFAHAEEITSVVQMEYTVVMSGHPTTGLYTGAIRNGIPHGFGVFTAVNEQKQPWHCLGEWENGVLSEENGQYWDYGRSVLALYGNNTIYALTPPLTLEHASIAGVSINAAPINKEDEPFVPARVKAFNRAHDAAEQAEILKVLYPDK